MMTATRYKNYDTCLLFLNYVRLYHFVQGIRKYFCDGASKQPVAPGSDTDTLETAGCNGPAISVS